MSRIGKAPIPIPDGVDVRIDGRHVAVTGPRGELAHDLPATVTAELSDGTMTVRRADDERETRALHGLSRALLSNMVVGVSDGFAKELSIVGVGYRAIARGGETVELALGFSHPVVVDAPEGISFEVPSQDKIIVRGIDKQLVGQVAADIRALRKPEPYKGKGVRYTNEHVARKAGKASKR
jgi:large subunit ribosomal protein L6